MRQPTLELIGELSNLAWFDPSKKVGEDMPNWVVERSKSKADAAALSPEWLTFRLMISNRMRRDLSQLNYDRFTQWNELVREVQKLAAPVIERAAAKWAGAKALKQVTVSLAWDIEGACIETEFADQMPPLFFVPRLLECYRAGRRPCGWVGPTIDERWAGASKDPVPAGKLLVF